MILYCKLVYSFPLTFRIFNTHPTYQLPIFLANSILISIINQRRFSIFLETTAISPAMIKLLTGAGISCLPFQNQTAKDEDKNGRQSDTLFTTVEVGCYRAGYCSHFVHCKVFIVFCECFSLPPPMKQQPPWVDQDLLVIEASPSHSDTPQSVRLLWTGDQPDYLTTLNTHKWQTFAPPAGFELTIPASRPPQTHTLNRAATAVGLVCSLPLQKMSATTTRCLVVATSTTVRYIHVTTRSVWIDINALGNRMCQQ